MFNQSLATSTNSSIQTTPELVYEFTSNADYLKQYAQLVIKYYKKDLNYDLEENALDNHLTSCSENEYIYIVRSGDTVIGGTKLSFIRSGSSQKLPMEEKDFSVNNILPVDYRHEFHGEIGRLVVDPGYRGHDVLINMVDQLMQFSVIHQCYYLFVLAPRLNAVLYRRICKQLNTPAVIHKDANLPDKQLYRDMGIQLLSCDLTPRMQYLPLLHKAG